MSLMYGTEKFQQGSKLTVDQDGYFSLVLGAINITSRNGVFYTAKDSVKKLFEEGSVLNKRLTAGMVHAEYNHPDLSGIFGRDTKETQALRMKRFLHIDRTREAGVFKDVKLVPSERKDPGATGNIIEIHGKFKPSGAYGDRVKRELEDGNINTAFSIRCWRNCTQGVIPGCDITIAITWDYVPINESPGIAIATKEFSIGLESLGGEMTEVNDVYIEDLLMGKETLDDVLLTKAVGDAVNSCNGKGCILGW